MSDILRHRARLVGRCPPATGEDDAGRRFFELKRLLRDVRLQMELVDLRMARAAGMGRHNAACFLSVYPWYTPEAACWVHARLLRYGILDIADRVVIRGSVGADDLLLEFLQFLRAEVRRRDCSGA